MTSDPLTTRALSFKKSFAVLGILFLVVCALQLFNRAYESEFGRDYDEAAHFVTGMMLHDFLVSMDWDSPLEFAENYYLHYPKVALGHWPPVFYGLQAVWYMVFAPSRGAIMMLLAVLTASLGWIVWWVGAKSFDWRISLAFSLVLVALPLTQSLYSVCMAEILLATLALLAALAWARYLDSPGWKWASIFSALAVLSILTKANALALAILPPISLLITRRWTLLKRASCWFPALAVALLCGPWYAMTLKMLSNGPLAKGPKIWYTVAAVPRFSATLVDAVGLGLLLPALIAMIVVIGKAREDPRGTTQPWPTLASLVIAVMVFHWIVPASFAARHLFIALPAVTLLALVGLDLVARRASRPFSSHGARLGALTLLTVLLTAWLVFEIPRRSWRGFGDVADYLTTTAELDESVVLVVSDSLGEGALISEVALRERRPGHIVLRGSKSLSRSSWDGSNYELLFNAPEELGAWLAQVPVGVIAVDHSVPRSRRPPETDLLLATLEANRNIWQEVGAFDMIRAGRVHAAALRLFVQKDHQNLPRSKISLDLLEMLGKHITGQAIEKDE